MVLPRNEIGVGAPSWSREASRCHYPNNTVPAKALPKESLCHPLPSESKFQIGEDPWVKFAKAATVQTPAPLPFAAYPPPLPDKTPEEFVRYHLNHLKIAERFDEIEKTKDEMDTALVELYVAKTDPFLSTYLGSLEERLSTLEKDQAKSFALLDKQLQGFSSPLTYGMVGDYLETLGDKKEAKHWFEKATRHSEVAAHHLWYQLKSLEQNRPEELANQTETLRKIRSVLPELKLAIEMGAIAPDERFEDGYGFLPPEEIYGTKEQIYALDALSWGLLHDAILAEEKPNLEALEKLAQERRVLAQARRREATELEARLHLKNMGRQALLDTIQGGRIETTLRSEGREAALTRFDQLKRDIRIIERMVHRHRSATGQDPLSEGLADLNWRLQFDGQISLDHPQEALQSLAKEVIPQYRINQTTAWHLGELQKQSPHLFDECGEFNPHVNMSETELGKLAASRTRSAYWISPNTTREIIAPLGGGVGGAAIGFGLGNLPGAMVGGGVGALLGLGGNTAYNINTHEAREAYDQSLRTGLSRIDERQDFLNKTFWAWSAGFAALGGVFWSTPVAMGTDFAIKAGSLAARRATLRGGWQRALQALQNPGPILAQTCAAAENCVRGGIHFAQRLASRQAVENGAVQLGLFFRGSLKNIKGGPIGFAARMGVGTGLLGSDLVYFGEPWKIDNFTGAFGFAVFINEGASLVYRTNANGLLVGNLARVLTEWAMQYQQDMPLTAPDTPRMIWASMETATMVFFIKSIVRGSEFLSKFPLGNTLLKGRNALAQRFPIIQPVLKSVTSRGTPRFVGLTPQEIKPSNGNGNGNGNGYGVELTKQRIVRLPSGEEFPLRLAHHHRDKLHPLGVTVEGNGRGRRLIAWRPEYRYEVALGGQRISYKDPTNDATDLELWRLGIHRGDRNRFVVAQHKAVRFTGAEQRNGNGYVPQFEELSEPVAMDSVTLGAKRFSIWRGAARSRPRISVYGAPLVALQTGATAWGVNRFVFTKQMRGDRENQPRQRTVNYVFSDLFTHPFIQWPLGYDKVKAEALGRLVGFPVNLGANMFFKTYRDQWPGQVTYLEALDRHDYADANENFKDNMTSLEVVPLLFGDSQGDSWFWETPALKEYRRVHDAMIANQDARRIRHLANAFASDAEKERHGDIPMIDRRSLRIRAAYLHSVLSKEASGSREDLAPLRQVKEKYPMLFKDLPQLTTHQDWEYFIGQINREADPAHDFHLYLK